MLRTDPLEQAVILAAGRGTRMGAITEEIPKPMLRVGGRPMLELILERLSAAGIRRFFVVVGYQRQAIENYFAGSQFEIEFCVQTVVNGTGAAALLARDFVRGPFLLTFGDILCEPAAYGAAMERMKRGADGALAVKAVEDPWQGAAVYEEGGRITQIIEKPAKGSSTTKWNSAGFYCFRLDVFAYLAALTPSVRGEYEITSAVERMIADGLDIQISPIAGAWRDVGRPEDLAAMNEGV